MEPLQFVYWLQGFMELADPTELDETQVQIIKDHLELVLPKVTLDRNAEIKLFDDAFQHPYPYPSGILESFGIQQQTGAADLRNIRVC